MKSLRILKIISVFIILFAQSSSSNAETLPTVVALFGDSITVGRLPGFGGAGTSTGFAAGRTNFGNPDIQLSSILNESNRPSIVVNWGNSGSSTDNGVARINSNLSQTRSQHDGAEYYVLIMYGTNDFDFGLSASDTAFNVGIMVDRARSRGYIPVVSTLTNRADQPSQVAARNSTISSIASSRRAPLVNQFAIFNAAGGLSLTYDGLHPNVTGYGVLAQGWFDSYLENVIEPERNTVITPAIYLLLSD